MDAPRKSRLEVPLGEVLKSPELEPSRVERLWAQVRARRSAHLGGYSEPPRAGMYLPAPIARTLADNDDLTNERSRLWRNIQDRRRGARSAAPVRKALALGFACAAAAFLLVVVLRPEPAKAPEAVVAQAPVPAAHGPLYELGKTTFEAHEAEAAPALIKLADGSEIRLAQGARIEPLLSSGDRVELLLTRGEAEFSVVPNGPRRWVVRAGLATVEVLGTVFRVSRKAHEVHVSVSRGLVLVRSESLANGAERLAAGQALTVTEPEASDALAHEEPEAFEMGGEASEVVQPRAEPPRKRRARRPRPREEAWWVHVRAGRFAEAYATLGPSGFAREVSKAKSVEALLSLADAARLSGHAREAVAPLERVLREFEGHPQAALAAFTLGRVYLDQLNTPAAAARAFERAIALHPPHALLSDCHARLVEAHARAGDRAAAERAAARYRTLFPTDRHDVDPNTWKKRP